MINRILVALFFIPLLIWVYLKGDLTFLLFTNVIVGVGLYEFYRMMKQANKAVALEYGVILGMLSSTLMYFSFKGSMKISEYLIPVIVFFVGSLFTIRVLKKKIEGSTEYIANTLLGILYIPLMFLHAYSIKSLENGGAWLLTVQLLLWISDSAAYFVGIKFGRKLIKKGLSEISPKKSYEGLFGSLGFTIFGIFLIKFIWFKDMGISSLHMIALALIVSLGGTVGDLAESMFKREFGVKDSGEALGEHGGILDRFDSMIFVLPMVFYYFKYIIL